MKLNHTLIGQRDDHGCGAVMLEGVIVGMAGCVEAERVSRQRGMRRRGREACPVTRKVGESVRR